MATIWASLNRPFFISQSSGSESYVFLYSLLVLDLGKRTQPLEQDWRASEALRARDKATLWAAKAATAQRAKYSEWAAHYGFP